MSSPAETEYTVRVCRRCKRRYVWPKGSRTPGATCPLCQPEMFPDAR